MIRKRADREDFVGLSWQPRHLLDSYQVMRLLDMGLQTYAEILHFPWQDLPNLAPWSILVRDSYLAYERMKKTKYRDQVSFLKDLSRLLSVLKLLKETQAKYDVR